MKKTRSDIMCLDNEVFHDVVEKGMIVKLVETRKFMYHKKSLTNYLYLKKWLFSLQMKEGTSIKDHFDQFNRIIMDIRS